ncbi:MAG: serine/threonine protein kinase [Oscillospiraceae bacterium]|nr:serine/threonine protein kinase [Oscillospiraceae bacterium]
MLQIGSLVDNKYKILSEVGHGGMSVVYLAINERANKTWAVKEIRKDGVCDFEAVKQGLVVETDMLKKLNHSHLPSIIDVIDTEDSFLIVMDYIEGKSLQSVLKHGGAQSTDLVIEWGKQLCDVLGYLHSREPAIIYRDMKPANVMLKPDGNITLIDFGTAREFKNRSMVEDTTCLGTRGYAAPEQFGGRGQTDARTDIYCLGATLYHLITGHSPAEPPYEIKPLSYWDPAFAGSGLEMIINKCCQQDPEARYQNCAELMYDLEHVSDMDYSTQRSRRMKWTAFVASVVLCAVGVTGMIGFQLAKNSAESATYDAYLDQAQMTSVDEFSQFVGHVQSALEVDPSRYEAYDVLLQRIESDGRYDEQTEWDPIKQCLQNRPEGQSDSNENLLRQADPLQYADIQFRIGRLMFLLSSGEDNQLSQAAKYFDRALGVDAMVQSTDPETQSKAKLAQALSAIGDYIANRSKQESLFDEPDYDYKDLWNDLKQLQADNRIDSMGLKSYGIALYSRVASLLGGDYDNFSKSGISVAEMEELLTKIETEINTAEAGLTETEQGRYASLIQDARTNISSARMKLSALGGGAA